MSSLFHTPHVYPHQADRKPAITDSLTGPATAHQTFPTLYKSVARIQKNALEQRRRRTKKEEQEENKKSKKSKKNNNKKRKKK